MPVVVAALVTAFCSRRLETELELVLERAIQSDLGTSKTAVVEESEVDKDDVVEDLW